MVWVRSPWVLAPVLDATETHASRPLLVEEYGDVDFVAVDEGETCKIAPNYGDPSTWSAIRQDDRFEILEDDKVKAL